MWVKTHFDTYDRSESNDTFCNPSRVPFINNKLWALSKSLCPNSIRRTGPKSLPGQEASPVHSVGVSPACAAGATGSAMWSPMAISCNFAASPFTLYLLKGFFGTGKKAPRGSRVLTVSILVMKGFNKFLKVQIFRMKSITNW